MTAPDPIVTAEELGIFLGLGADGVDTAQATLAIELTVNACLDVVDPLPVSARAVVMRVAAFAYGNPVSATGDISGDRTLQFANRLAVSLSRKDRADLRRSAGRSAGAFTINLEGPDVGVDLAHNRDEGYVSPDGDEYADVRLL